MCKQSHDYCIERPSQYQTHRGILHESAVHLNSLEDFSIFQLIV